MRVGGSVGNPGDGNRSQVHAGKDAACSDEIKRERRAGALALAGRLTAVVLAGRVVARGFRMRGGGCRRDMQGASVVTGLAVRGRDLHCGALRGHRLGDVHLQPNGQLQCQDGKKKAN